ncbi:MAG TPA: glycosyl hydrolase family 28-related protein [Caulobacteraceae bacterium]|jgi:hypothetical protein|nr:glycosyl hydrolase family 28-related protein [Caulobacteraceae bacterium]
MAFANSDLSNATYQASGSGASIIPALTKLGEILNILDYGGDGGGSADNTSALTSAVAALPSSGGAIWFPPGIFKFNSAVSYTVPDLKSVSLIGAGPDATSLYFPTGNGLSFTYTTTTNSLTGSVHLRDLSITTAQTNGGVALSLVNTGASATDPANSALNDITSVNFRGQDGFGISECWATSVNVEGVSNVNLSQCTLTGSPSRIGIGLKIFGTSPSNIPVILNISMCNFWGLDQALVYGDWTQGVTISQSNFTWCTAGINIPAAQNNLAQLSIQGSQFACIGVNIFAGTEVGGLSIIGNWFATTGSMPSVNLQAVAGFNVVGNFFGVVSGSGGLALVINGTPSGYGGTITGNMFSGPHTYAVWLQSGSSNSNVQSNCYFGASTNVQNDAGAANTIGGGSP